MFACGALLGYVLAVHRSGRGPTQWRATTKLGPWSTSFKLPASVQLPDKDPMMKFDFQKDEGFLYDQLKLTVTNLTNRSYAVSYRVYGYNSKGSRVSEDLDKFAIGKRERLITRIELVTYGGSGAYPAHRPELKASSFAFQVELEQ